MKFVVAVALLLALPVHAASLYSCSKTVNEVSFYACGDDALVFTTSPTASTPVIVPQVPAQVGPTGADGGVPAKWVRFDSVLSTALIAVCELSSGKCPNKNGGVQAYALKSDFTGTTPPVVPPVTPPVTPTPPAGAGSFPVTCTAPTKRTDGQPVDALTYTFVVNAVDYPVGNVCKYDPVNPAAGTYTISVKAQDSSGMSSAANPVTVFVAAPVTPPITQPIVTEKLGTWKLMKGISNIETGLVDYAACKALAASKATATPMTYFCDVRNAVSVKIGP